MLSKNIYAIAVIAIGATSCSSIVKKPEINGVRKVAIVSLYADEMIPWTGGRGRVDHFDRETKERVGNLVYKAFASEFRRLKWEVMPIETVANNATYKKEFGPQQVTQDSNILAKTANVLGNMKAATYFTPTGLLPLAWPKEDKRGAGGGGASFDFNSFKLEAKKDFKGQLADLSKTLGVDLVVVIGMDYCYTGATAVLGNGTAKFTAGSFVKAVNHDKVMVVDMPDFKDRCEGPRGESDKTVAMVGGSVVLGQVLAKDAMVTAISEAGTRSAKISVEAINKAILN